MKQYKFKKLNFNKGPEVGASIFTPMISRLLSKPNLLKQIETFITYPNNKQHVPLVHTVWHVFQLVEEQGDPHQLVVSLWLSSVVNINT